jgi:endonuclease/exonuclease/phosphatase family metal-dependent hydrolase
MLFYRTSLFRAAVSIAGAFLMITSWAVAQNTDVVLYGSKAPVRAGTWSVTADRTAASGYAIGNPSLGAPALSTALANPTKYFEMNFPADAGQAYQLWIRGKSLTSKAGAVYVQFSDSVSGAGANIDRIGTVSAEPVVFQDSTHVAAPGWGWQDNAPFGLGRPIYFATTGTHKIRVQVRQDGLLIDQIVLSPQKYLSSSPGTVSNDSTILAQNLPTLSTSLVTTSTMTTSTATATATITSTSTSGTKLRIMQANIFYGGHGTDNLINLTRLAGWVVKFNPDIASLTEVIGGYNDPVTLTSLVNKKTGISWYYSYVPKYPGCPEGVMILSKWPIKSSSHYYMSYQMPIAQATISVGGKLVNFFATHFQWPSSASGQRQTEAKQLVAYAAKFAEPRVIAGDFNAQVGTAEINIIMQKYYSGWDAAVSKHTASAYADNPPGKYTRTRKSRIDHVFYSRGTTRLSVSSGQVPDTRNLSVKPVVKLGTLDDKGVRPSDHNFMGIVFNLY